MFDLRFPRGAMARQWLLWLACTCSALLLISCGGGVGEGGTGGSRIYSSGQVTGLSDTALSVSGVAYDRAAAQVVDAFGQPAGDERLALGTWVEVEGSTADAGRSGTAQTIRLKPAARGLVTAVDDTSRQITVLGSAVGYDDGTFLDGVELATELRPGDFVEVHGALADDVRSVLATRIEKLDPGQGGAGTVPQRFELKGTVSQLDLAARTMRVGGQAVDFAQAQIAVQANLASGRVARVSAAAPPSAGGVWTVDRVIDDRVLTGDVPWVYAEGVVSQWVSGPQFALEGLPVDARQAEKRAKVTGNGLRVAVVGSLEAGVLKARAVTVSEPGEPMVFTVSGIVKKFTSLSDFRVSGVPVDASQASVSGGLPGDLGNGRKVRIKGQVQGHVLMATRLEFLP